jgi:hypothetical protein
MPRVKSLDELETLPETALDRIIDDLGKNMKLKSEFIARNAIRKIGDK